MLRGFHVSPSVSERVSPALLVSRISELLSFIVKTLLQITEMLWSLNYLLVVRVIIPSSSNRVCLVGEYQSENVSITVLQYLLCFGRYFFWGNYFVTPCIKVTQSSVLRPSRRAFLPLCVYMWFVKVPVILIWAKLCLYWQRQSLTEGWRIKKIVRYF